jgi:uncharacterized membrane protein
VSAGGSRAVVALALELTALAALALSLLGASWLDTRSRPPVLVLVDRSQSVPRTASNTAVADVVRAAKSAGAGEIQFIEFAGKPAAPSTRTAGSTVALDPSATNIEAALESALAVDAQTALSSVVIVSDGLENVGDAARALQAAREAHLPVQWDAVSRPPPQTHIAEVLAPDRALIGQPIRVDVQLAGRLDEPLRVKATARTISGQTQVLNGETDFAGRATFEFDAGRAGALLVDVELEDPMSRRELDAMPDAAVIDVAPHAAVLYAQGASGTLARSLLQGGWKLDVVPAGQLDAHADGLDSYQAVILEDVSISDASPQFWNALVAAVKDRGLGLMVLGGKRSFARGGYHASVLESILPVLSEPAVLDQPASIVFVVDKSGSMGQGTGGVDRFQLAQRAVVETARGLTERDSLGLVVFDVAPRALIPLGPAPAGALALARDWRASPGGGTKLAPALEAAIGELERSSAARRVMVLVTDGFVDKAPLAQLRARLDRSRIETIALAVGPDADVEALRLLFGAKTDLVLRVNQAAELPSVMRSQIERRRARIERGVITAEQRQGLPFSPGTLTDWPAITAYSVTRSRPQAVTAVQSQRGDPLIAWQRSGHGRVVAVTSGLGPWTPQWLQWREWPRLAGGLAEWISGTPQGGGDALTVSDLPDRLNIEADIQTGVGRADPGGVSITADTPMMQGRLVSADPVAPGRLRGALPDAGPGLYTFLVSTSQGTQRQLHLRRHRAEGESWGTNPELKAWANAGLIRKWKPDFLPPPHDESGDNRLVDRSLMGLGLLLFLAGVLVDRQRLDKAGFKTALQRLRSRV